MADDLSSNLTEPEILPAESTPSGVKSELVRVAAYHRSGPLPDSREFAKYEEILPGSADRILRMAEKQSEHRMEMEKAVITGGIANERYGLAAGVTTVVATLAATGWLAQLGFGAWGIAAVFAEIGGIVYSVRHIANKNAEERERNAHIQQDLDADQS